MKKLLHAMGCAFLTVLIMLLIIYGWAFIQMKLLLKSYPELFGYIFYQQKDEDMVPEFDPTDIVVIKKDAEVKANDVAMFFDSKDSKYKVYYVVTIDSEETVTRCATCKDNNEPISTANVVGKAIGKIAFMGPIIQFFKQKSVLIFFAVIGVISLLLSQYLEYIPIKKADTKQNNVAKQQQN